MESSAPKLPESAEASTYSPEGAPMSADDWLKSELTRIALSDDLHDATELKNLQVAAPRYGLKLEIPALKKKLKHFGRNVNRRIPKGFCL